MTTLVSDLIGLTEIADLYQVTKNTANGWTKRPDFPEPKHRLAMGPMWDKGEVAQWLKPNNFPQELILHCAHCQGRGLIAILGEFRQQKDRFLADPELVSMTMVLECGSCGESTHLTLGQQADARLRLITSKEALQ